MEGRKRRLGRVAKISVLQKKIRTIKVTLDKGPSWLAAKELAILRA